MASSVHDEESGKRSATRGSARRNSGGSEAGLGAGYHEDSFIGQQMCYVESDIERKPCKLNPPSHEYHYHVYCSPLNPGARQLLIELQEAHKSFARLKLTTDVTEMGACEQMLVYLRGDTWSRNEDFADEVVEAMRHNMPLLLVYEQTGIGQAERFGVTFEVIIAQTPRRLLRAQIYSKIAVPLKGGLFRRRSLTMLGEVLAAVRRQEEKRRWMSFSDRRTGDSPTSPVGAKPPQFSAGVERINEVKSESSPACELSPRSQARRGFARNTSSGLMRDERVWERLGGGLEPFMPISDDQTSNSRKGSRRGSSVVEGMSRHVSRHLSWQLQLPPMLQPQSSQAEPEGSAIWRRSKAKLQVFHASRKDLSSDSAPAQVESGPGLAVQVPNE